MTETSTATHVVRLLNRGWPGWFYELEHKTIRFRSTVQLAEDELWDLVIGIDNKIETGCCVKTYVEDGCILFEEDVGSERECFWFCDRYDKLFRELAGGLNDAIVVCHRELYHENVVS